MITPHNATQGHTEPHRAKAMDTNKYLFVRYTNMDYCYYSVLHDDGYSDDAVLIEFGYLHYTRVHARYLQLVGYVTLVHDASASDATYRTPECGFTVVRVSTDKHLPQDIPAYIEACTDKYASKEQVLAALEHAALYLRLFKTWRHTGVLPEMPDTQEPQGIVYEPYLQHSVGAWTTPQNATERNTEA